MSEQIRGGNFHDAPLNAAPQISLVLEVHDVGNLLAPQLLGEVPDHLYRHELAAVSAVVDESHVVQFAQFLDFICSMEAEVVENQRAGSFCDVDKSLHEGDEVFLLVALLPRLAEYQLSQLIDHGDGRHRLEGKLVAMDGGPLETRTSPHTLLTLSRREDRFIAVVDRSPCMQLLENVREGIVSPLRLSLQLLLRQIDLVLQHPLPDPAPAIDGAQLVTGE